MLCEYIKHENELFGYSCLAMSEISKTDKNLTDAYIKAFFSIKDHINTIDQNKVIELYKQSVNLFKNNKRDEFTNYFVRNFSNLLNEISKNLSSDEIKNHAQIMLKFSEKYQNSNLQDVKWSFK